MYKRDEKKVFWERKRCLLRKLIGLRFRKVWFFFYNVLILIEYSRSWFLFYLEGMFFRRCLRVGKVVFVIRLGVVGKVILIEFSGFVSGDCCCCWFESCLYLGGLDCVGFGEDKKGGVREYFRK